MAGALYGVFLATLMLILTKALPGGPGWMIFFMYSAVHLAVGAAVVWRRTGLRGMTAAFVWGALASSVLALMAARGLAFDAVFWRWPVLILAVAAVGPVLMFSERWRHPDEYSDSNEPWTDLRSSTYSRSVMFHISESVDSRAREIGVSVPTTAGHDCDCDHLPGRAVGIAYHIARASESSPGTAGRRRRLAIGSAAPARQSRRSRRWFSKRASVIFRWSGASSSHRLPGLRACAGTTVQATAGASSARTRARCVKSSTSSTRSSRRQASVLHMCSWDIRSARGRSVCMPRPIRQKWQAWCSSRAASTTRGDSPPTPRR